MKKVNPYDRYNIPGLSVRKNKKNGFAVVELDYWADPRKDAAWAAVERPKMDPKMWAVEMERSWETFAGKPVYDRAYYKQQHILGHTREADLNYPIFRGWDFGGNQSCVITQIIGPTLYVLDEMPNGGLNTRAFAPEVIAYCNRNFGPEFHYIDIVDPSAAWEGKTAEGKACTDVMREYDLTPKPAPSNDPQKRIEAVIALLMSSEQDHRCLQINPGCTMLIKGFEGGYHYPEKPGLTKKADRPVKNLYSHIHDALQYVALRMRHVAKRDTEDSDYESSLTQLGYNFGGYKKS